MDLTYWRAWIALRWQEAGQGQRGANLVEYILLIAFIAIIVILAVKVLGRTISKQFSSANSNLS
jgi:Flp pilus assembly pilin Flp